MNIGITGHTKGLGKYLYKELDAIGYSRTNGYELNQYQNIIKDAEDLDVFINNTFHPKYQQQLFLNLFGKWKDSNKTIINILNLSTILQSEPNGHQYLESKKSFHKTIIKTMKDNKKKKVRLSNLYLGTLQGNENYPNKNKLKYKEVLNSIQYILSCPSETEIGFMSIGRTTEYLINKTI
jgi:lipopolysaccharide export LptBFGC system permease protein LptF